MTVRPDEIAGLRARSVAALVTVAEARGSTPRESGAWMVVTEGRVLGTIGGGQLEYMVIDAARAMLARGGVSETLDIPLGPEIGQCCGGRTVLTCTRLDDAGWEALAAMAEREYRALPGVLIFGAGHVGRALAAALALLPVRPVLIDQRPAEIALGPARVEAVMTALPEAEVVTAAPGSAFVILTHDHALDFLIAREALARGDAAYVGMIGSKTKRATFERWLARTEDAPSPEALVSPIGAAGRPDKRPKVIAAFVATEILAALVMRAPLKV
jgi:xanthine dehydrogenase accessory factor